jgi:hypothetical protein
MYQHAAAHDAESIYRVKMMLSLNCVLELADGSVVLAQIAVENGTPLIVKKYIQIATEHWNHHDRLLITLNDLFLESYTKACLDIPRNASASDIEIEMQDAENSHGQIPGTVHERATTQTLFKQARINMLSRGTLELRHGLMNRMSNGGIFDATEAIQKFVKQGAMF